MYRWFIKMFWKIAWSLVEVFSRSQTSVGIYYIMIILMYPLDKVGIASGADSIRHVWNLAGGWMGKLLTMIQWCVKLLIINTTWIKKII